MNQDATEVTQVSESFWNNLDLNLIGSYSSIIALVLAVILLLIPNLRLWALNLLKKIYTKCILIFVNRKLYHIQDQVSKFLKSEIGNKYIVNHSNKKLKQQIFSSFNKLKRNKVVSSIEEDVYYVFLFSLLEQANSRIWAASISDPKEWTETEEEKLFLELNIAVTKRLIPLQRIFIIKEAEAVDFLKIEPIKRQIIENETSEYYFTYYVYESEIPKSLLRDISNGFLAFDDFVVAKDVFSDNEIRGVLETESLAFYNKLFNKLIGLTKPLNFEYYKSITGNDLNS